MLFDLLVSLFGLGGAAVVFFLLTIAGIALFIAVIVMNW